MLLERGTLWWAALWQGGNYCEALQWGVAAGSASAFCETLATGEEIRRLYDETINIIREEC